MEIQIGEATAVEHAFIKQNSPLICYSRVRFPHFTGLAGACGSGMVLGCQASMAYRWEGSLNGPEKRTHGGLGVAVKHEDDIL